MASISTIVTITITKGTQSVAVQAFNVATIFGPSARFVDAIKYYEKATFSTAMIADGFLISDPEFIFASEYFSQTPAPTKVGVSHFTASVAQVDTFTVSTLVDSHNYTFTLNGTPITYNSGIGATQQSVLDGLNAAIVTAFPSNPPVTGVRTGTGGSAILTLTSTSPGIGVTYTAIDVDLAHLTPTANHSIVSDIAATQLVDDTWYGILVTSHTDWDILQIAAYAETQLKIYGTCSSDAAILTGATTDLASILKGKAYTRTFFMYHATPTDGIEAAWVGRMFPTTPGAANWNFKTLAGITPDNLNPTQITNAQGKNANVYITVGGVNIATVGVIPSGDFIDVTILIDWITSTMQANVYSILVNNDKVPFTNKGIAAIENGVSQTLQQAQDNGGLAAGWTVSAPDISAVPNADKASRTLNGVSFSATLAGAINKVNIQGFVGV